MDASGLALSLRDTESPASPPLAERPQNVSTIPRRDGFELRFPTSFGNRQWRLDVFPLPGAFLPDRRGAIEAALIGVLVSLIGLVLLTSVRMIARLRRQAERVGPYRLTARLGHGAMGVVWEARHALLRRPTAVKLLAPGTEGERALARFEREVQLTAGLTHPSTIAIYDYGRTADGVFYYAMELLRGINLGQLIDLDGPIPPGRVVHLLRQACGALTEAHAAGLIHRDIKPANLMLCIYGGIPDFLKVLDFGLVKEIGDVESAKDRTPGSSDAALSQDGSLLGTPLYMAPEGMSDPGSVDARSDIFALGAVGYFLLTGKSPFPGRTAIEVFKMERQGPPPPLSLRRARARARRARGGDPPVPVVRAGGAARVGRGAGRGARGLRRRPPLDDRGCQGLVAREGPAGLRPGRAGARGAPGTGPVPDAVLGLRRAALTGRRLMGSLAGWILRAVGAALGPPGQHSETPSSFRRNIGDRGD